MTRYQKAICILLTLDFLLSFGGIVAFGAEMPILGMALGVSGILSFLSIFFVLRREEKKEEEAHW